RRTVCEFDRDRARAGDDMVVRDDVTGAVDHESRAESLALRGGYLDRDDALVDPVVEGAHAEGRVVGSRLRVRDRDLTDDGLGAGASGDGIGSRAAARAERDSCDGGGGD